MDVVKAIEERRAYRSLDPIEVTDGLLKDLAEAARLAPSCFNNQPWRFVFVHDPGVLEGVRRALSKGNEWAKSASMIVAVASKRDYDCMIKGRDYYLFDTGMATAFMILRATELGLVAHPIAGYDEEAVKVALGIPADMTVITLLIVGKRSGALSPLLSEKQVEAERRRPDRLPLEKFAFMNCFSMEG